MKRSLFSGTFYVSRLHTEVNNIPNTPHIIEMTIQNAIYGTLHASIYVPSNIQNSTILGIFTNSTDKSHATKRRILGNCHFGE